MLLSYHLIDDPGPTTYLPYIIFILCFMFPRERVPFIFISSFETLYMYKGSPLYSGRGPLVSFIQLLSESSCSLLRLLLVVEVLLVCNIRLGSLF